MSLGNDKILQDKRWMCLFMRSLRRIKRFISVSLLWPSSR